MGPEFGYWVTRGAVVLIVLTLVFTALAYIDRRRSLRSTQADQDAKLAAKQREELDYTHPPVSLSVLKARLPAERKYQR
jgi:flagellar biosynthesis/type III secretory pathway M-ring protein FliF/YscJ